jgi:2-keto-myo-inositol isomerase
LEESNINKQEPIKEIMISRRNALKSFGLLAAGAALSPAAAMPVAQRPTISYCLNVSTIRGQNQGFLKEFEITSKAGYSGIEIWIDPLQKYLESGGTLPEIAQRTKDLGLTIENAIGFARWIVDDETVREKGIEQLKREMGMLAKVGCRRIAAPPMGAHQQPGLNLDKAAERYHRILETGKTEGVVPQLEFWGASTNLNNLAQALYVAAAANHPDARLLSDVYHMHRGDSGFEGLKLIAPGIIEIFHMNDYPGNITREKLTDSDRVYPGDGIAPIKKIIRELLAKKSSVVFSLELFNKNYWEEDGLEVATTGLRKMKVLVAESGESNVAG